jgi:hypothetical protein
MASELENSVASFTPEENPLIPTVAFAAGCSAALIGLIVAAAAGSWFLAFLFLLALFSLAAGWFLGWRSNRVHVAELDRPKVGWQSSMPEIQRQDLNIEVIQLSKVLDVSSDQIADLQSAYIVAEDLALRQIQQEEGSPLLRHVTIGNVPFTAVLVKDDYVACLELSFLVSPEVRQDRIEAILRKISAVKLAVQKQELKFDIRLMLVLITQLTSEDEAKLRSGIKQRFADAPVTIDIRFLDFESLQRIYVTD